MGLKDLFGKIKDKGQDIASNAIGKIVPAESQPSVGTGHASPDTPSQTASVPPTKVPAPPSSSTASPMADRDRVPGLADRDKMRRGPAPVELNDTDDSVYWSKQAVVDEIEERFGRFGPRVSAYLLTHLISDAGIQKVLEKLQLKTRGFPGGDKQQVEKWLETNGPEKFMDAVGMRREGSPTSPTGGVAARGSSTGPSAGQGLKVREIKPGTPDSESGPRATGQAPGGSGPSYVPPRSLVVPGDPRTGSTGPRGATPPPAVPVRPASSMVPPPPPASPRGSTPPPMKPSPVEPAPGAGRPAPPTGLPKIGRGATPVPLGGEDSQDLQRLRKARSPIGGGSQRDDAASPVPPELSIDDSAPMIEGMDEAPESQTPPSTRRRRNDPNGPMGLLDKELDDSGD